MKSFRNQSLNFHFPLALRPIFTTMQRSSRQVNFCATFGFLISFKSVLSLLRISVPILYRSVALRQTKQRCDSEVMGLPRRKTTRRKEFSAGRDLISCSIRSHLEMTSFSLRTSTTYEQANTSVTSRTWKATKLNKN